MKKFSVVVFVTGALIFSACTKKDGSQSGVNTQIGNATGMLTSPGGGGGLQIENIQEGTGAEAVPGKTVSVHYTGKLLDGKEFDSSRQRGPFKFKLGAGQVIPGWDQGVAGMKVGGKRKLTIPPELAYGDRGAGNVIPGKATLVFDVELLAVE